jgi:hypothetical protein
MEQTLSNIVEQSKKIKSQADRILKDSGIIEILQSYGEVKLAGSYALDVMLRPDIDIYVVASEHNWEKVLDIQFKISKSNYFREVDFVNWFDFSNEPSNIDVWVPSVKGYYFRPIVPLEGELWKMDIWLITSEYDKTSERTDYFKKLLDSADESKKSAILEIKEAMRKGNSYIDDVDGKLIYKAVLELGINTPDEFRSFLSENKG